MKKPGERVGSSYVPFLETEDGYRWLIFEEGNGYQVVGKDGKEQYATEKEANYNMPDFHNYYVEKYYYG